MPFKGSSRGAYGPQGQKAMRGPLAPVWVTSGTLPQATPGTAYSYQLSATDDSGVAPIYTLASGSLPTGLSISSSGLISGTPSNSGTFNFTVRATDENTRFTDSSSLTLVSINPELYSFTTATFGTNGVTGRDGPNITQARAALGNPAWANTYLNMTTNGIQLWTVPVTATYRIQAYGASSQGYNGASAQGDIVLTKGDVIKIACGQPGTGNQYAGAGGTFVVHNNGTVLIVAGGGAGTTGSGNQSAGQASTTGGYGGLNSSYDGKGGINGGGGGGGTSGSGSGGGGYCGNGGYGCAGSYGCCGGAGGNGCANGANGGAGSCNAQGGFAFTNGAQGAPSYNSSTGGFGGGGSDYSWNNGGGGGGGYSGGGGGSYDQSGHRSGGGGGSYISGANQSWSTGSYSGPGKVIITKL